MSKIYIPTSNSTDGLILGSPTNRLSPDNSKGFWYIQDGNLPLRPLSALERDFIRFWADPQRDKDFASNGDVHSKRIPLPPVANWGGNDVRRIAKSVGLMEHSGMGKDVPGVDQPVLTGKVFYGSAVVPELPRVAAALPKLSAADLAAIGKAVPAPVIPAFPKVPSVSEIALAVIAEMKKPGN